ncbi:MAG: class I SAM-dependent methyltransferase [Planctomycetota bacterium]
MSLPMPKESQERVKDSLEFLSSVYNYNHWIARTLEPFCGARILELGCGIGSMVPYFLTRKAFLGADNDPRFVAYCEEQYKDHLNCRFFHGDLAKRELALPEGAVFDTILSLNVIEHLEDDVGALEYMASLVPDGGNLVLLLPAHPSIHGHLDDVVGHFRRYSKEDLLAKIGRVGLRTASCFYFNVVGYVGWGLNSRVLGRSRIPVKSTLMYDKYIVPLQAWLEGLIHPPFGQSIILHAVKT